jgi:hypothetical protein
VFFFRNFTRRLQCPPLLAHHSLMLAFPIVPFWNVYACSLRSFLVRLHIYSDHDRLYNCCSLLSCFPLCLYFDISSSSLMCYRSFHLYQPFLPLIFTILSHSAEQSLLWHIVHYSLFMLPDIGVPFSCYLPFLHTLSFSPSPVTYPSFPFCLPFLSLWLAIPPKKSTIPFLFCYLQFLPL